MSRPPGRPTPRSWARSSPPTHDGSATRRRPRPRPPPTSPGKTTVADLEVVTAPGAYHGVVTFSPERAIRGYVQECVTAACLAAWSGADDATLARRLLQHPDQKFRLQYVLGEWPSDD